MIEPSVRIPPANKDLPVNDKYIEAVNLNAQIHISAQAAQQNLYDMCMGFKKMRDSKLYKELGYENFDNYCTVETGINRNQAYKYITIVENLPNDFVSTRIQNVGVSKLVMLAKLSEEERTEITENTDLENTSVRELEEKIKFYQEKQSEINKENQKLREDRAKAMDMADNAKRSADKLKAQITSLESQIKDLESRPIDVAVQETSSEEKRLQEVIKSLERENIKQNEALEAQYRNDVKEIRENLEEEKKQALKQAEKDKQERLSELRQELEKTKSEYEQKLAQNPKADDTKVKFKIYLTSAYDAMKRLAEFTKANNNQLYVDKVKQLLQAVKQELEVE